MRALDLQPLEKTTTDNKLIITILGDTIANAKVIKNDNGDLLFSAPSHVFKLGPIEELACNLVTNFATETQTSEEKFNIDVGIKLNNNHTCQAFAKITCNSELKQMASEAIIFQLLEKLKPTNENTQAIPMSESISLMESTLQSINKSANSIIKNRGGSPITTPLSIFIDETKALEFRGKYKDKQDLSDDSPSEITVNGQFDGFRGEKRCLFIKTNIESIEVFWETDAQKNELVSLTPDNGVKYNFKLIETRDKRGMPLYSYKSVSI